MKRPFVAFALAKLAEIGAISYSFPGERRLELQQELESGQVARLLNKWFRG